MISKQLIGRKQTAIVMAGLLGTLFLGCSWPGSYLKHDWTIEKQFDNHEIFNEYQYYTGGSLGDPRGIVALKPEYRLESPDWQPVAMTPGTLAEWIEAMKKDFFVSFNTFPNGAKVVGNDGMVAGLYYSVWEFPTVKLSDEKTIRMTVPEAEYRSTNRRVEFFTGDDRFNDH